MEELFIPLKESLILKELGFNEPCFGFWLPVTSINDAVLSYPFITTKNSTYPAPLYQQAFKWFREKHNICGWVSKLGDNNYRWHIDGDFGYYQTKTYEEAELECLRKLIEIVKNK